MNIVVFCGSPKIRSCTKQYAIYLQKINKEHDIDIIDIGTRIKLLEEDVKVFNDIIEKVRKSDGVLWATPVYSGIIPSQFMRFIELIFERNVESAFNQKYAAHLSTSIHFADNVAANYINAICDDLNMKYVGYCPSYMKAIDDPKMIEDMRNFMSYFLENVKEKRDTTINFNKVNFIPEKYKPVKQYKKLSLNGKKVIILVDSTKNENLNNMIRTFRNNFEEDIQVINISENNFMLGGCIACMKCSYDYGKCAYDGKDNFKEIYKANIATADVVVIAGEIKRRFLSSTWKGFLDRMFFNNHTPTLDGKQLIYLVSGAYRQMPQMAIMFDIFTQYQDANLLQVMSDEYGSSEEIDDKIYSLCKNVVYTTQNNYMRAQNFLGIGGHRVLRDEIYGEFRYPFIGDFRSFKKSKLFDYPEKKIIRNLMNDMMRILVTIIPGLNDKILSDPKGMPFYKRLKKLNSQNE